MVAGALSKLKKKEKKRAIGFKEMKLFIRKKKIQEKKQASVRGVKTQNRSLKLVTY